MLDDSVGIDNIERIRRQLGRFENTDVDVEPQLVNTVAG